MRVLEEMERKGINVSFFVDKERLDIFFNYLNYFNCNDFEVMVILFRLLVVMSISNVVLREVFDKFFYKGMILLMEVVFGGNLFKLVFKVLLLFFDGEVVKKVLMFWREVFFEDLGF